MWTDKLSLGLRKQMPATPKTARLSARFLLFGNFPYQLDSKRRMEKARLNAGWTTSPPAITAACSKHKHMLGNNSKRSLEP
jgi:hypothetical protein